VSAATDPPKSPRRDAATTERLRAPFGTGPGRAPARRCANPFARRGSLQHVVVVDAAVAAWAARRREEKIIDEIEADVEQPQEHRRTG
jgi:hypothetical protein